jgi:hypothetical protein
MFHERLELAGRGLGLVVTEPVAIAQGDSDGSSRYGCRVVVLRLVWHQAVARVSCRMPSGSWTTFTSLCTDGSARA